MQRILRLFSRTEDIQIALFLGKKRVWKRSELKCRGEIALPQLLPTLHTRGQNDFFLHDQKLAVEKKFINLKSNRMDLWFQCLGYISHYNRDI